MVELPARPVGHPVWVTPLFEWSVLGLVVCVMAGVLWHETQFLRKRSERTAVQTTLQTLRTALVTEYLHRELVKNSGGVRRAPQTNPFALLDPVPSNYGGEVQTGIALAMPQGQWLYERDCVCVAYRPLDSDGLQPESEAPVLRFYVSTSGGPQHLQAREPYQWGDVSLR